VDAITFWTAFAAVVSASAFLLALLAYMQGKERIIGWSAAKSQVRDIDHRLINTSHGLIAEVVDLNDNFVGSSGQPETMIRFAPTLPVEVIPQNWMPIGAHQILGAEPIAISIRWRQKRVGARKFRPRVYSASIFL
jgi:hypothetical protein